MLLLSQSPSVFAISSQGNKVFLAQKCPPLWGDKAGPMLVAPSKVIAGGGGLVVPGPASRPVSRSNFIINS